MATPFAPAPLKPRTEMSTQTGEDTKALAQMVLTVNKASGIFRRIYEDAKATAKRFASEPTVKLLLIGSAGSKDDFILAEKLVNRFGKKLNVVVRSAEYLLDYAEDEDLEDTNVAMFNSRTGQTDAVQKAVKTVESLVPGVLTVAIADQGSPVGEVCQETIPREHLRQKPIPFGVGQAIVNLTVFPLIAAFMEVIDNWGRTNELFDLLDWACGMIPLWKTKHHKQMLQLSHIIHKEKPPFLILVGREEASEVLQQKCFCAYTELTKQWAFNIPAIRLGMGPVEAMSTGMPVLRLAEPGKHANETYEKLVKMKKPIPYEIALPDTNRLEGHRLLKKLLAITIQGTVVDSVTEYVTELEKPGNGWEVRDYLSFKHGDKN